MFNKFISASLLLIVGMLVTIAAMFYYRDQLPWDIVGLIKQEAVQPVFINVPIAETANDFTAIANAVSPSVVNISADRIQRPGQPPRNDPMYDFFSDFFAPPGGERSRQGGLRSQSDLGSGLIVSADGYILTSSHVVTGAHKITIRLLDGREFAGRLIGADPKTDLAVIKIDAEGLLTIPWGDSDNIRSGQFVLAIGNPFGLSHTITMGIVSAVGRANVGIAEFEDFIQTDAAINPGNSGGPLVSKNGELVGINTAIFTKSGGYQGIGFAVPGNMAKLVMEQLISQGRVVRGWLGVLLQELTPELAAKFEHTTQGGALVSDTLPESPARAGGIKSGDIVIDFDGQSVADHSELKRVIAMSEPGRKVSLKVLRGGKVIKADVVVGELKQEPVALQKASVYDDDTDAFSGLSVIALTPDIASQLNLEAEAKGVVVAAVEPGTPAAGAGIKRGDVLTEIDRQEVRTLSEFRKISNSLSMGASVLVLVDRGGQKFFLTISL